MSVSPPPRSASDAHALELSSLGAESCLFSGPVGRLHVLDYGGDRTPMLVMPGITSPAITWDFIVAELRDLVRPVVLDFRGRGLSDAGPGNTASDLADDAAAAVEHLALEVPLLLGHSLGARAAAVLATRMVTQGAILVDPPLSSSTRGPYPTSWDAFHEQLREGYAGTTGDAVRRFYPRWPRAELLLRARWVATCDEAAVRESYQRMSEEDFFDWWPRVPPPVALVRGGSSPVVTESGSVELRVANPSATHHVIAGAGHMVGWDAPEAFLAEIRSIVKDHLADETRPQT